MAKVVQKYPKEPLESMIRRFKKKLEKDNTLKDLRKHDYYLSPSQKKALKRKMAMQRRMREEQMRLKAEAKAKNNQTTLTKEKI